MNLETTRKSCYGFFIAAAMLIAACGGSSSSPNHTTTSTTTTTTYSNTTTTTSLTTTTTSSTTSTTLPTTTGTISGTASQGAVFPVNTLIYLKDATGTEKTGTVTGSNGAYSISINGLTAPFILKTGTPTTTFYSYADTSGTVNINPLTDVAVRNALGFDPTSIYTLSSSQLAAQLQTIKTNISNQVSQLKTYFAAMYPSTATTVQKDFMNGAVTDIANSYDKLFDNMKVQVNSTTGAITITQNGQSSPLMTITKGTSGVNFSVDISKISSMASAMASVYGVSITAASCDTGYVGAAATNIPAGTCSSLIYCVSTTSPSTSAYYLIKGQKVTLDLTKIQDTAYLISLGTEISNACK